MSYTPQQPTTKAPAIAVIEDSAPLRENLVLSLTVSGKKAWGCESAEAFYRQCCVRRPDIVLVDLGLPGEDGISMIGYLRQIPHLGIIVVTARGSDDSLREATAAGADHYFVKPVKLPQLLGAIDALWRRLSQPSTTTTPRPWLLDLLNSTLVPPGREAVPLSAGEAALLASLCSCAGQIVGKNELCAQVFGGAAQRNHSHLDVLISRLRNKAKKQDCTLPLRSIFGKGLTFVDPIVVRNTASST
jgi:two-component system response regulator PhoP